MKIEKTHSDKISALSDYYLAVASYYEYVTDVSGKSLSDYQTGIDECMQEITTTKKAVEIIQ